MHSNQDPKLIIGIVFFRSDWIEYFGDKTNNEFKKQNKNCVCCAKYSNINSETATLWKCLLWHRRQHIKPFVKPSFMRHNQLSTRHILKFKIVAHNNLSNFTASVGWWSISTSDKIVKQRQEWNSVFFFFRKKRRNE